MIPNKKTELLAPAGSYEAFKAGLNAGADAFYLGGDRFGARAYADNFTQDVLIKTLDEAHIYGKNIYLTINTLFKENELRELYTYLLPYYEHGLDAVIIQDVGALRLVREAFPDLPVHISTQMTVTGWRSASLMEKSGADRVVPARELSLDEIKKIRKNTSLEIECFVHGALCYCYSGACFMSSFIGGRSGNRGRCAQPCRLPYTVSDKYKTYTNSKNMYALNTKDICLVDNIMELVCAGIDSFKIEGRMKRPEYTAGVVSVYRRYLDLIENGKNVPVGKADRDLLNSLFNRDGFSKSYFFQHNGADMIATKNSKLSGDRIKKADEAYAKVKENIIDIPIKKHISAKLDIADELRASFYLTDGGISVSVYSDEVSKAKNRPIDAEFVKKQLSKTGGTEFEIDSIEIKLPDDVFMTAKQLNELRREALEAFRNKLTEGFYRKSYNIKENLSIEADKRISEKSVLKPELWISVLTREQLDIVKDIKDAAGFYIPIREYKKLKDEEKAIFNGRLMPALDYVSRNDQLKKYIIELAENGTRFLVRSLEDAAFLIEAGHADKIRPDYTIYTTNSGSLEFWRENGVLEDSAPVELNKHELSKRDNSSSELIAYGKIPLMVSAQCIRKTYGKCDHSYGSMKLTDRKKAEMTVSFECDSCYNLIYNSVPISLLSVRKEAENLGFRRFRLIFTYETKNEILNILKGYFNTQREYKEDFTFTRGHFNRGVE